MKKYFHKIMARFARGGFSSGSFILVGETEMCDNTTTNKRKEILESKIKKIEI